MESIYYVMAWACHRKCRHCYEDRFRPYVRDGLEAVVAEAERNFPRIAHAHVAVPSGIAAGAFHALARDVVRAVVHPVPEAAL